MVESTIFENIYQANYKTIYRYVYRLSANEELAKDLCQECFIKLFTELKNKKSISQPKNWLYKTASNLYFTQYNRTKIYEKYLENNNQVDSFTKTPEDDLVKKEETSIVRAAISKLNKKERTLILLYQDNCTYNEMAEICGMKFSSVGKTLSRAIDKLGKMLIKYENYAVLVK